MGKLTESDLIARFAAAGYELPDLGNYKISPSLAPGTLYQRNYQVIHIECGNLLNKTIRHAEQRDCSWCGPIRTQQYTMEEVKRLVEAGGEFELAPGQTYQNTHSRSLKVKCRKGHITVKSLNVIMRGSGCGWCTGQHKPPEVQMQELIDMSGYEPLPGEVYVKAHAGIWFRCPVGHIINQTPNSIRSGSGCLQCAGRGPTALEERMAAIESKGFKVIGRLKKSNGYVLLECICGNPWRVWAANVIAGKSKSCGCVGSGFDKSAPAVLYLIRVNDLDVKVGITNLHPDMHPRDGARVPKLERSLPGELVAFWRFDLGAGALKSEKQVKKHYKGHRVKDEADGDGYTERIKGVHFKEVWATVDTISICNSGK